MKFERYDENNLEHQQLPNGGNGWDGCYIEWEEEEEEEEEDEIVKACRENRKRMNGMSEAERDGYLQRALEIINKAA